MTTFKYFLIFVTFILLTSIECALKKDYNNISRSFYKYSISNKNNQNIEDFVNLDKYSSHILYIQKRPSSLSKEKYAERIINIQNSLDLPKLFKSEKNEIIDFLKEKNTHRKQKRQTTTPDRDVIITVTIYGKGQDIIIIKEVVPEVPDIDARFNGRDDNIPTTIVRQPPAGSWDWFPTLRTINVYGTTNDQSPTRTTSRPLTWYDYTTESTTTSTTRRPWNWFGYTKESITTTTSTPTPFYSEEPSSGTQEEPIEGEEEEKTEETSTAGLFNWFNWNSETTEAATTTTTTTTLRSPLWNPWFSSLNPSSETTTSTTSNNWDNWIISTTQQSSNWDWNTTPEITTTTTESTDTTTKKFADIFSWFG